MHFPYHHMHLLLHLDIPTILSYRVNSKYYLWQIIITNTQTLSKCHIMTHLTFILFYILLKTNGMYDEAVHINAQPVSWYHIISELCATLITLQFKPTITVNKHNSVINQTGSYPTHCAKIINKAVLNCITSVCLAL